MRKSKFTPEQILQALRQAEAGTVVGEICRKLGVTEATFYRWKKTYAGFYLGELRELRQLREENRRLKGVVADLTLDKTILRDALGKKMVNSAQRRAAVRWAQDAYRVSERRACRALVVERTMVRYQPYGRDDQPVRARLRELAPARPAFGHERLHVLIRREGWVINHKKTHRLYKAEGLQLKPRRPRRRRAVLQRTGGAVVTQPNQRWAMDFMHDTLASGTTIRIFTVVDVCTRECVALSAAPQFRGTDVAARLSAAGTMHAEVSLQWCSVTTAPSSPRRRLITGLTGITCSSTTAALGSRSITACAKPSTAA
jgi:putative transposase